MEQQIAKLLVDRVGLSQEQADKAVDTVLGYLKENPDQLKTLMPQAKGIFGKFMKS